MNAQTRIPANDTRDTLDRAHRATIRAHLPGLPADEMTVRVALAALRDQAMLGQARAESETVRAILHAVAAEAMAVVYAPMPFKRLFLIRAGLANMLGDARFLEKAIVGGGR
jgi:hypothetical protein